MVWVGTSGYNYPEWKGSFYPADLAAKKMLPYYAARFPTVEINYTFYRMPTEKLVAGWAEQVPSPYQFTLKAPRRITHDSRLKDVGDSVARFCEVAATLGDKLGTLLFQLPPFQRKDLPVFDAFLGELPPSVRAAFEFLESAVAAAKIHFYGMATWNAFRQTENSPDYLSLATMESLARDIAGGSHHFRFVQLPCNLGMTEALTRANQSLDGRIVPMVEAANKLGITLMASASMLQGKLSAGLPSFVTAALGMNTDAERALQFVRSTPGITTALVGMSRLEHVSANLSLVSVEPASQDQFSKLFERGKQA